MEEKEATHSISGVIENIAPECFTENGYSYPLDWWAVGILAYDLAVGFSPFYHEDMDFVHAAVQWPPLPLSDNFKDFVV